jgi:hypothetical protein
LPGRRSAFRWSWRLEDNVSNDNKPSSPVASNGNSYTVQAGRDQEPAVQNLPDLYKPGYLATQEFGSVPQSIRQDVRQSVELIAGPRTTGMIGPP